MTLARSCVVNGEGQLLTPAHSPFETDRVKRSRGSCVSRFKFASTRLGVEFDSHPVRTFEQSRDRFSKSAGDNHVQEE